MGPPGAHLDAGAHDRGRLTRDATGDSATGLDSTHIVVGDERGIEPRPRVPAPVCLGVEAAHPGVADVMRDVGVAVESPPRCHRGSAPASASIGRCHRAPPTRNATSSSSETARMRISFSSDTRESGAALAPSPPAKATGRTARPGRAPRDRPESPCSRAHAQHRYAVPQREQRCQRQVKPGDVEAERGRSGTRPPGRTAREPIPAGRTAGAQSARAARRDGPWSGVDSSRGGENELKRR